MVHEVLHLIGLVLMVSCNPYVASGAYADLVLDHDAAISTVEL
jgi:hypothetical protein